MKETFRAKDLEGGTLAGHLVIQGLAHQEGALVEDISRAGECTVELLINGHPVSIRSWAEAVDREWKDMVHAAARELVTARLRSIMRKLDALDQHLVDMFPEES